MTYQQKVDIQKQVVLGQKAPANESAEAAAFRVGIEKDLAEAKAKGQMLSFSTDWD